MVSATTTDAVPIETAHEDMIVRIRFRSERARIHVILIPFKHDAQLDYYGKRLATCSSDRTVKVFNVVDGEPSKSGGQTLKGYVSNRSAETRTHVLVLLVTPAPSGRSHGHTPSSVISSHRVRTMAKYSSGESKRKDLRRDRGRKSRTTRCIARQVLPAPTYVCSIWPSDIA